MPPRMLARPEAGRRTLAEPGHPAPTGTYVRRRTGSGSPPGSSAVPQAADPRPGRCRCELRTPAALGVWSLLVQPRFSDLYSVPVRWGGWGSNPRPADYEKSGSALRAHYLHGYRGALPPMALIAQVTRST